MGSRSSETTTKGTSGPSAWQLPALNFSIEEMMRQFQEGISAYEGETIAGFTPEEQEAQRGIFDFARGPGQGAADAYTASLTSALNPQQEDPFARRLGDIAAEDIGRDFNEYILPGIRGEAIAAGQTSGSGRAKSERLAGEAAGGQIADVRTKLLSDAYTRNLASRDFALGLGDEALTAGAAPQILMGDVAAQIRAMEQAGLDADQQEYYFNQFMPLMLLQQLFGMASTGLGSEETATTSGPPSFWEQIFGSTLI